MAITLSVVKRSTSGRLRELIGSVTCDSSYTTGGYSFVPNDVGLGPYGSSFEICVFDGAGGYQPEYDYTNKKIKIYRVDAVPAHTHTSAAHTHTVASHGHDMSIKGGQAAAGTDAISVKTSVLGKESATDATVAFVDLATKGGVVGSGVLTSDSTTPGATGSGGSAVAAPQVEVSNGVNLSAVTFRFRVGR